MQPETAFARIPDTALTETDPPLTPTTSARGFARRRTRWFSSSVVALGADRPRVRRTALRETDADLTRQHAGEPLGERITVTGRVLGSDGKPLRGQLVEIWQANAAGRYRRGRHARRAARPELHGVRALPDGRRRHVSASRRCFPAPIRGNHPNAWRPKHIHFSLFGRAFPERLVTQMYFGRSALPVRPDLQLDPRRARATAARSRRSSWS